MQEWVWGDARMDIMPIRDMPAGITQVTRGAAITPTTVATVIRIALTGHIMAPLTTGLDTAIHTMAAAPSWSPVVEAMSIGIVMAELTLGETPIAYATQPEKHRPEGRRSSSIRTTTSGSITLRGKTETR